MPDISARRDQKGRKVTQGYLERRGFEFPPHLQPDGEGYDLLAVKSGRKMKIEVKGSGKLVGIPDCYGDEFDRHRKLKADYLYVVRLKGVQHLSPVRIDIISKREVDGYSSKHSPQTRIRLASALKTDLKNGVVGKSVGRAKLRGL